MIGKNFDEVVELNMPSNDLYTENEISNYYLLADIIVADGYHFDSAYQRSLKSKHKKLIYIDDLVSFEHYADVIINHALGIDSTSYHVQPYTKLCLGPEYLMLKEEFILHQPNLKSTSNSVIICFGGADPQNYSEKVINLLQSFENLKIHLIIGQMNRNFAEDINIENLRFHRNLNPLEIIALLQQSKLMICSASTIAYESCSVGIPLCIVKTADNQQLIANGLVKNNCASELNLEDALNCRNIIGQLLTAEDFRNEMILSQSKIFQTDISKNFTNLFNQLIN